MARRKKVPLFEVMQQSRLKEQQRAAQADLQAQRERLREQRRVEEAAKAAAELAENGPPPPSRLAGLLGSLGLAPRTNANADPISEPDRDDPTAGRNASSLYRRVRESRPAAIPEPSPPATEPVASPAVPKVTPTAKVVREEPEKDFEPIEPRPSPFAGLATAAADWGASAKASYESATAKVAAVIKRDEGGQGDRGFQLGPIPIAVGTVALLTLVAIGYFATRGGDDQIAAVESPDEIPLDPAVTDIGDGDTSTALEFRANRGMENAPPIIVEPEPTADREPGKIYVAVLSYKDKAAADGAAADLRRAGISVTVEYDLAAYPDRYTVVGTKAFDQPGTGDWEPYVNNIKDVSENRRRTGKHDPFEAEALFWGRR
ncbi:MAG: hypothetical protein AAGD32_03755 [Planctomycetota bacterium]